VILSAKVCASVWFFPLNEYVSTVPHLLQRPLHHSLAAQMRLLRKVCIEPIVEILHKR
jgi:hypothetical protein